MGACDRKSASLREGQRGRQNERKDKEDKRVRENARTFECTQSQDTRMHEGEQIVRATLRAPQGPNSDPAIA